MSDTQSNLCVVFADVSGSTRLYDTQGDAAAFRIVGGVVDQLKRSVAMAKGRVVKTIGDEVMAVFPSAEAGILAACDMQQRVAGLPPYGEVRLAVRIGLHAGPVIEKDGDVFGDTVNVAARMAGLAKAEQIVTTQETVATLPVLLQQSTRQIADLSVKGKDSEVSVCEVIWADDADLTMQSGRLPAAAPVEVSLRLRYGGEQWLADATTHSLTLGRDVNANIVVRDPNASRQHAKIERRRDKFVLVDSSTNGTYVSFDGEAEITLKREECILRGKGAVSFGRPKAAAEGAILEFEVR